MYQIDLTRFYGIDAARLNHEDLDTVRHAFADAIVDFAASLVDGCGESPLSG